MYPPSEPVSIRLAWLEMGLAQRVLGRRPWEPEPAQAWSQPVWRVEWALRVLPRRALARFLAWTQPVLREREAVVEVLAFPERRQAIRVC